MSKRASRSYLIPHLLRRLFWRRETIAYPKGPLRLPESYRGKVAIEIERCIGCGQCSRVCPTQAIEVERRPHGGVRVLVRHERCANCGLCAQVCPRQAVRMEPLFRPGALHREDLTEEWSRDGQAPEGCDLPE